MLPEIERIMALDNVITVVDAEQFPGLLRGEMATLARMQVQDADMIVLNKVDLVDSKELAAVKTQVHDVAPRLRILEATHGRIPLNLMMGSGIAARSVVLRHIDVNSHNHPFSTWHWTSDKPLSLPRLRSVIETLPDTIYRLKGPRVSRRIALAPGCSADGGQTLQHRRYRTVGAAVTTI